MLLFLYTSFEAIHSYMCFIKVDLRLCPSYIFYPKCVFELAPTNSTLFPSNLLFTIIFTVRQVDSVRLASQRLLFKNRPGV